MADPIQRWAFVQWTDYNDDTIPPITTDSAAMERDDDGSYVLAADAAAHEAAAVAAAEQRVEAEMWRISDAAINDVFSDGDRSIYAKGQRDERARIRAGVVALITQHHPMPPEGRSCVCHGGEYRVLAVIDAAPCCTCGSAGDAHLIGCPAVAAPQDGE